MKVAIYIRVSTHYQVDKDSLPLQRNDLINYCEFILNTKEYEVFEDAGYSGKNTERPAYQNMMQRIRKGEFSHVLVWKIDRISRNLLDFCDMYEEIKKYNCTFVSKNEQFDTSSAMGEAMLKIILVFAELERKLTGERVTAIMMDRATKGLWNGAPVPLGYDWSKENKFPIINKEEAETIKFIFNTYKEKRSTLSVLVELQKNNIRTKKGRKWTTKTIGDIIKNPFYKGTYRYNYRTSARGKMKDKKDWIIVDDNHPGIISKDLWNECNEILKENAGKNTAAFRKNTNSYVFSGILRCGECGSGLTGQAAKARADGYITHTYYCMGRYQRKECSQKTINEKIIGKFIFSFLSGILKIRRGMLTSTELLKKLGLRNATNLDSLLYSFNAPMNYKKSLPKRQSKSSNGFNDYNKEREKFKRALDRLEDLYLYDEAGLSEKDYVLKKNKILKQLDEIDIEEKNNKVIKLEALDFSPAFNNFIINDTLLNSDVIDYEKFRTLAGVENLKDFLNKIIKNIVIENKRITKIEFKNNIEVIFTYVLK